MAAPLSGKTSAGAMGLFFVESNASDNDNWIGDHSGQPNDLDWAKFTLGDDALHFQNWKRLKDSEVYNWWIEEYTKGEAFAATFGLEKNTFVVSADVNSDTYMEDVKDFCKRHNRDSAKNCYLFNRRSSGSSDFEKFYGAAFSEYKYLPCKIMSRTIIKNENESKKYEVIIAARGVWE